MSSAPILLNKKSLEDGLFVLLSNYATDLQTALDAPAVSTADLRTATTNLSNYLGHFHRRKSRRFTFPLKSSNLSFHLFRTRNPIEFDENALTNSPKDWYQLVLSETEEKSGDVQILVDGGLTKDKAKVLDEFRQEVWIKVKRWEEAERAREKVLKNKKPKERKEREDLKKRRHKTKKKEKDGMDEDKDREAVLESEVIVGGDGFLGDEMMINGDDRFNMAQDGKGSKMVHRDKPDEQTRRVRFEEMMDESG